MDAPAPDDHPDFVDRRQLLRLAGGVGLSVVGACSGAARMDVASAAPPAPGAMSAQLLCRDAWGAKPARSGGRPRTFASRATHWRAIATWPRLLARARTCMPTSRRVTSSTALTICWPPAGWTSSAFAAPTPPRESRLSRRGTDQGYTS